MVLDALDRAVLRELQFHSRVSDDELAAAIGANPVATADRVRALVESGVIRGYRAKIDLPAIGRPVQALISVRVRTSDDHLVDAFREWVACAPEAVNVFVTTGSTDFVVHVAVRSTDDLYTFVVDQLSKQAGVVDVRTSVVFEHLAAQVLEPFDIGRTTRHHQDFVPPETQSA